MDGEEQRDGINMTSAFQVVVPYLENPRRTVLRNEGFVAVAAALLFLQFLLAPWRRRSGHWLVQGTLWVAYTISFPLVTYTLGQMATSAVKHDLYPIWTLILFWAAGCANALMAYSVQDSKQWKRHLFELLQYFVYLAVIMRLLLGTVVYSNLYRVIAGWMVTNSIPSKLVADYMRAQVDSRAAAQTQTLQEEPSDPITVNGGYRYLVRPSFRGFQRGPDDVLMDDAAVTIDHVWQMTSDDSLLETPGGGSELKDVCLSFALSHLLRRHYFELDCAEVGLPETFRFALEGLLPETDQASHYSRAFHVIEVELGFLYDFFFTKYATLFEDEFQFLIVVVLKSIFTSICGALVLVYYPFPHTVGLDPIADFGTRRVDGTVTVVIMGALLLFEALQVILYLTSDWATVSLACSYAREDACRLIPSIIRILRRCKLDKFLGNIKFSGYWKNKLGQSSVVEGSLGVDRSYVEPVGLTRSGDTFTKAIVLPCLYIFGLIGSMTSSAKKSVPIPDLVKDEIVSCLRRYRNGGPLTNGKAALDRNGVLGEFSCTLENHSQKTVMLIWHIATEYCSIASSDEAEVHQSGDEQVATTLSKYCAYLMVFVPELLPGNSIDTLFVVHDVLLEVKKALGGSMPTRHSLLKAIQDSESSSSNGSNQDHTAVHESSGSDNVAAPIHIPISSNEDNSIHDSGRSNNDPTTNNSAPFIFNDSIFIKGLKLGRALEQEDAALRWKLVAEFWAETIIYIAPSDKAAVHMERLAQGGEFLTHIWALLKHAGITNRDQRQKPEDLV